MWGLQTDSTGSACQLVKDITSSVYICRVQLTSKESWMKKWTLSLSRLLLGVSACDDTGWWSHRCSVSVTGCLICISAGLTLNLCGLGVWPGLSLPAGHCPSPLVPLEKAPKRLAQRFQHNDCIHFHLMRYLLLKRHSCRIEGLWQHHYCKGHIVASVV